MIRKGLAALAVFSATAASLFAGNENLEGRFYVRGIFGMPVGETSIESIRIKTGSSFDIPVVGTTNSVTFEPGSYTEAQITKKFNGQPTPNYSFKPNTGFGGEVGGLFILQGINLGDQFAMGIDWTALSFKYSSYDAEEMTTWGKTSTGKRLDNPDHEFSMYNMHAGSKLGLLGSYNPVDQLVLDLSVKANFMYTYFGTDYMIAGTADDYNFSGFAVRPSVNLNVRYNVLMVGAEFAFRGTELTDFDEDNTLKYTWKSPGTDINLHVGFAL